MPDFEGKAGGSKPSPTPMGREALIRAHIGFAAMLNGIMVDITWVTDLRGCLRHEVMGYFDLSPVESAHFDKNEMLALLDEYNEIGIHQMLHHLGKCPYGHPHESRLETAVRELMEGRGPICERVGD